MFINVCSRRILGVEVHGEQCCKLAREFFDHICCDEKINKESATVLYSDNGALMRSFTLAAKMEELGKSISFSRPRVSNDNAFAESIFPSILSVREWVDQFIAWYNEEYRHSGIKYVTPNQRHFG